MFEFMCFLSCADEDYWGVDFGAGGECAPSLCCGVHARDDDAGDIECCLECFSLLFCGLLISAGITRIDSVGLMSLVSVFISLINSWSSASRPAVSTSTRSYCASSFWYFLKIFAGSFSSGAMKA